MQCPLTAQSRQGLLNAVDITPLWSEHVWTPYHCEVNKCEHHLWPTIRLIENPFCLSNRDVRQFVSIDHHQLIARLETCNTAGGTLPVVNHHHNTAVTTQLVTNHHSSDQPPLQHSW